ncbi:MAG: UDP-2,3-diacylglucosamine diphosphatase [Deltaproteobacteria bacterium]|nr:UDP-2,3-diacylglucosamine diphosphatase [Deltaproteobacteria bacterium]
MRAVFLSDAHLKSLDDPEYQKCMQFLDRLSGRGDGAKVPIFDENSIIDLLVVAGDFFDFWFERDGRIYPEFKPVIDRLLRLKRSGVRICLCEGNHDFFLADYFTKILDIEVYPLEAQFDLDGKRIIVSHGDTVDQDNRRYQTLRRFLRSRLVYRLQRLLPLSFLWQLARFTSEISHGVSQSAQERLAGIMHDYAVTQFQRGIDAVILGHSHQVKLEQTETEGGIKTFALLGDWTLHYSYLVFENGRFVLSRFV